MKIASARLLGTLLLTFASVSAHCAAPAAGPGVAPTSVPAAAEKAAAPSSRQCREAVAPGSSSSIVAENRITAVLEGISGRCCAALMSGAMSVLAELFAAPGEPPALALSAQF